MNESFTQSVYAIRDEHGTFFAGFNATLGKADVSAVATKAKWFTNRYDIKLRPGETLVELKIDPEAGVVSISEPFRPRKRTDKPVSK
jgi:hypothetical protein